MEKERERHVFVGYIQRRIIYGHFVNKLWCVQHALLQYFLDSSECSQSGFLCLHEGISCRLLENATKYR